MPIINITNEDLNKMQRPDAGWSLCEIVKLHDPVPSKDKNSINYSGDFKCISGPGNQEKNAGRYLMSVQLLNIKNGNMVGPMFTDFIPAALGIPFKEFQESVGDVASFDTSKLEGGRIWLEIVDEVFAEKGTLVKKVKSFAPDGAVPF